MIVLAWRHPGARPHLVNRGLTFNTERCTMDEKTIWEIPESERERVETFYKRMEVAKTALWSAYESDLQTSKEFWNLIREIAPDLDWSHRRWNYLKYLNRIVSAPL